VLITEAELFDEPGPAIIYVNEAFEKLTGYTQEEVIGKSPRFLQGPKSDSKELERLSASLRKWEPSEVTVINYKKNGDAFWNNFSVCPVANEKGRFTHCISISRDVTRIKILELQKKLLSDTSHIFNETTDLKDSLVKVLGTTLDFADFILAELWLVSADKRKINLTASAAKTHDEISFFDLTKNGQSFSKGQGMPGFVWKQKSIEQWKNPGTHKYFLSKQAGGEANITGAYGIPLLYDTDVVGVLILGFNKDSGKINNLETVFETFGSHVGAEIKRKQSENALNQVFNTAPDIICTLNFDGYFQRINKAGCTLLEYSEAELLSTPYLSFVHPGDIPILAAEIDKRAVGIDIFYFENRYITKTGKTIWLSWSCRYAADEELIYGVAKDITDKKELEALLNKANTLAKIGGWEIDLPEKTIFWSTITCEIHEAMHGYSPTIENALNFYKKGKNSDNIFRYINEAIETGKSFDDEFKIITAKGNERWVRVIGEAVMNNGKCIRISGSIQDIDERKKTEEEIKLSNERYDMVAKATNDAIWDWNITTNEVKRVNDGYKTLFGYDAAVADADNNFWMNKVHPDDLPGIMKKRNDIFYNTNELYWQDEYRFLKQNGVYAWVNDRGYIIRDEQGKPVRMIGATQDITTLKENEIQLEKRAKALAVSNEELEQFAYVASHDLQEPLRIVTSFLTLINKKYSDKLDDKGKKYIDFAVDGAKRMRNLILDLLEFSRAGRKQEAAETINLTDLLQEIVMLFRKQIAEKNAVISAVDLPAIQGYRVPLRQVFQNLVGNALKYSSQGKPVAIQVSAIELPNHWQFAIADNGIGISREYFEKIFIIFQRLHNKDEYSGTGMGLAVTKKIVETLGGHIWVESEKGKGSTFYFTLAKELAK
jgi:PAS domain S-box-containing protein